MSHGQHVEIAGRTHVSGENSYAVGVTAEARDGVMTGGALRTSDTESGRKNTLHLAVGAYQGDAGEGIQGRIGGSTSQSGSSIHGSARVVAADQGARVDVDGGARPQAGAVSIAVGGSVGGGLIARIEHDEQGAFVVVEADGAMAGRVAVGRTVNGGDGGKAAALTRTVGLGLGGAAAIRRRLDGMQAAQAQHAIDQGDNASLFSILGVDGPQAVLTAATAELSPGLMQSGESHSTTTSTSVNIALKAEVGVGYAGFGATGFADASSGSDQSLIVTLDPQPPAFDTQYEELLIADTGALLAGLAALHPGSVLTGVDAVTQGGGMTASVGATTGTGRLGTTATDQTVQEGDDTVRTRTVSGGASGRVPFGDLALSAQDMDTLATVERNGEVQAMTLDIGESTVSFTAEEVEQFIARSSSPSHTEQAARNMDVGPSQRIAFPTLLADLQRDLQQAQATPAKLDLMQHYAKTAPRALIPMLDRIAVGVIHMPSDDLGTRTEWPDSLDYQASVYAALMDSMPDSEDTAMDLITLANRTRELDDVENALHAADFTSGRARLDMLEQCFRWRQQLAAKNGQVAVDVSEVGTASSALSGSALGHRRQSLDIRPRRLAPYSPSASQRSAISACARSTRVPNCALGVTVSS